MVSLLGDWLEFIVETPTLASTLASRRLRIEAAPAGNLPAQRIVLRSSSIEMIYVVLICYINIYATIQNLDKLNNMMKLIDGWL